MKKLQGEKLAGGLICSLSILNRVKIYNNIYRNNMSKPRLNALILMYVQRYIMLDYEKITDFFATTNPRKMLLILLEKIE